MCVSIHKKGTLYFHLFEQSKEIQVVSNRHSDLLLIVKSEKTFDRDRL